MSSERAEAVIDRYNEMAARYAHKRAFRLRYSDRKVREAVMDFIAWCDSKEVEPVEFVTARIYYQMEELKRAGMPKVTQLRAPKLLINGLHEDLAYWYHRTADVVVSPPAEQQQLDERSLAIQRRWSHEKFKQLHVIQPRLCLAGLEYGGGFHPHSEHCALCSLKAECAQKTNQKYGWDVVQARASCREIGS